MCELFPADLHCWGWKNKYHFSISLNIYCTSKNDIDGRAAEGRQIYYGCRQWKTWLILFLGCHSPSHPPLLPPPAIVSGSEQTELWFNVQLHLSDRDAVSLCCHGRVVTLCNNCVCVPLKWNHWSSLSSSLRLIPSFLLPFSCHHHHTLLPVFTVPSLNSEGAASDNTVILNEQWECHSVHSVLFTLFPFSVAESVSL